MFNDMGVSPKLGVPYPVIRIIDDYRILGSVLGSP